MCTDKHSVVKTVTSSHVLHTFMLYETTKYFNVKLGGGGRTIWFWVAGEGAGKFCRGISWARQKIHFQVYKGQNMYFRTECEFRSETQQYFPCDFSYFCRLSLRTCAYSVYVNGDSCFNFIWLSMYIHIYSESALISKKPQLGRC